MYFGIMFIQLILYLFKEELLTKKKKIIRMKVSTESQ